MSRIDPCFVWTLLLAPRRPAEGVPSWPALITRLFGEVELGLLDPIEEVLRGPFPHRVLARAASRGLVLSGLGDGVAISSVATEPGEVEETFDVAALRRRALGALIAEHDPEVAPTDDDIDALLAAIGAEPDWEVGGLVEVEGQLCEGLPEDLPDVPGWLELGRFRLQRSAGVGEGHAAWYLEGWFTRLAEQQMVSRRMAVLSSGYGAKVPAIVEYGWSAIRWGRAARSALRRNRAVAAVLEDVRAAASWAVAGEPPPGEDPQDLARLLGRLQLARTSLQEVVEELRQHRPALRRAMARILGDEVIALPDGPFVEASERGDEMIATLSARIETAGRWVSALEASLR